MQGTQTFSSDSSLGPSGPIDEVFQGRHYPADDGEIARVVRAIPTVNTVAVQHNLLVVGAAVIAELEVAHGT